MKDNPNPEKDNLDPKFRSFSDILRCQRGSVEATETAEVANTGGADDSTEVDSNAESIPSSPPMDWKQGIADDIRNHPSFGNFKDTNDLAKSWLNAQKLVGKDKIPLPGENATKQDWNDFYNKLGRPEEPTGYALPEVQLPEGITQSPEMETAFRAKVHELGLLPNQVAELYSWYANEVTQGATQANEAQAQSTQEAETSLRREWGTAFDQNLNMARNVIQKYAGEDAKALIESSGLGNDVRAIKLFANIGKNLSEDGLVGESVGSFMSPSEAQGQINSIMGDKKSAYWDKMHPEHDMMVQKMRGLHQMANPDVKQG